jgi:hypothetical protein
MRCVHPIYSGYHYVNWILVVPVVTGKGRAAKVNNETDFS